MSLLLCYYDVSSSAIAMHVTITTAEILPVSFLSLQKIAFGRQQDSSHGNSLDLCFVIGARSSNHRLIAVSRERYRSLTVRIAQMLFCC
jgi:hypothetical protein